ncbi:MAG TPA: acyloxyacyl hydrolase [Alphaproteobacteria bacterium]|nr:acyloxyacyl hydrolase [Alphaproteobacteria bacterium]
MAHRLTVFCCAVAFLIAGATVTAARADDVVTAIAIASGLVVIESLFVDTPDHDEPDFVAVEGGAFDPVRAENESAYFDAEYRSGFFLWKLKPFGGIAGTADGSFWGYVGVRLDTYWGRRIIITPSFALVGYDKGNGKNLGSPPLLGRSGFDFQYRFDDDSRIGLTFHHMSNGKALGQSINPGTELVGISYSVPVKTITDTISKW